MKIEKGQVWKRNTEEGDQYFPKKGWKVKVVFFTGETVIHKVVEFDGVNWGDTGDDCPMETERFLELYTLSKL